VVNPDDIVATYGADTLRLYEMFMGPFDQSVAWSSDSIVGCRRFVERVWRLASKVSSAVEAQNSPALPASGLRHGSNFESTALLHQTIKKVTEDIESMSFNTAISTLMILLNALEKEEKVSKDTLETFLQLIAPFAPHFTEELWASIGHEDSIHLAPWPRYDESKIQLDSVRIAIQVNGKVRDEMVVERGGVSEDIILRAKSLPQVEKWIEGKEIKKEIYIKDRLVSIVVA